MNKNLSANNMPMRQSQYGVTLIELMIAVAVVGILAMIAVPSYRQYVVKSNRAAAEAFIMSVANKQEQYMMDARAYSSSLSTLGMTAPSDVSKHYTISISGVAATPPAYTVVATPTGSQATNDTQCGSVSINQAGTKAITGTSTVAECW